MMGVIEMTWSEFEGARKVGVHDRREILRRVRPRIRSAYGSIWTFLLIRIAAMLITWWLSNRTVMDGDTVSTDGMT